MEDSWCKVYHIYGLGIQAEPSSEPHDLEFGTSVTLTVTTQHRTHGAHILHIYVYSYNLQVTHSCVTHIYEAMIHIISSYL